MLGGETMEFSVERAFDLLDQSIQLIQNEERVTYLDGLALALKKFNAGVELTEPSLQEMAKMLEETEVTSEQIRKVIQLAIIKGMKGSTQQQHMITPDSIALFIGYFLQKFLKNKEEFRVFDPASGTGNLLTAVINQVEANGIGYGSEIDPTLIQIAVESANLQEQQIEFFHQDSLTPLLLEPVDFVIADLPVGYYPDDTQSLQYQLRAEEGHSYAHHLFIEQSIKYTKEGGYLLFLIPNFLFTSDQSEKLQKYLREHTHIVSLMQLPLTLFTSEKFAKSLFILQKKGQDTKPPKQALMAQLPSFKDVQATDNMLKKIDKWFKNENLE